MPTKRYFAHFRPFLGLSAPVAVMLAIGLAISPGSTRAMGSSSGSDSSATKSSVDLSRAKAQIEQRNYSDAIASLEAAKQAEPRNPDIYSLLGFAHRKLGNMEFSYANYRQALELDPEHRGAHEYLGEYYLETDDLEKAKEHLAALDRICLFGCKEYTELKKAIEAYVAANEKRAEVDTSARRTR